MTEDISYKEKLRSLQFAASPRREQVYVDKATDTKSVEMIDQEGRFAGAHIYHGSGRVDAHNVINDPISILSNEG